MCDSQNQTYYNSKGQKYCSGCNQWKNLEHYGFYFDKTKGKQRIQSKCKDCKRLKDRKYSQQKVKDGRNKTTCSNYQKNNKYKLQKKALDKRLASNLKCSIGYIECRNCGCFEIRKYNRSLTRGNLCEKCRSHELYKNWHSDNIDKTRYCKWCGDKYQMEYNESFCSDKCRGNQKRKYDKRIGATRTHAQRAKKYGGVAKYNIKAIKVFERDNWKCKICGCKVQKENIYNDNAAELDHIVPLSIGGHHTYSNIQTSCRKCNLKKSNTFNGQLLLGV